MMKLRP